MNIAAVVVTYNRLTLLRECLNAFYNQTRRPNELIVVNNASSDGTRDYLKEWTGTHKTPDMKIVILDMKKTKGVAVASMLVLKRQLRWKQIGYGYRMMTQYYVWMCLKRQRGI